MLTKATRVAVTLAVLSSLCGCAKKSTEPGPTPDPPPSIFLINTNDSAFSPMQLTVSHGDTVTWVNTGLNIHTATSGACAPCIPNGVFASDSMTLGESYTLVFAAGFDPTGVITFADTTGTFPYFCSLHRVTGTVTVVP